MNEKTTETTEIILTADQVEEVKEAHKRFADLVRKYNIPTVSLSLLPTAEGVICAGMTHFDLSEHMDTILKARGMGVVLHRSVAMVAKMTALKDDPMASAVAALEMVAQRN